MAVPAVLKNLVLEVPDFETPEFCRGIVARANSLGFQPATITSENGTQVVLEIRNNDRVIFDDPVLAKTLWHKVNSYFQAPFRGGKAVCLNERFRIYRYRAGQFFDWHQDGEFVADGGLRSKFTMMIYLSDESVGGGTSFSEIFSPHVFSDFTIEPSIGKALFFHHPLSHRGDPIISGEKYVLRTDVMFALET
ncbi:2OG-Fe(II) oxygenase [Paracoccus sp. IB05]|uniref:2OG-Fe(II) oxygenase n=1 Tax=Paracoccus sp. IB05 TaxID=2779367 RepID=UPI0018E744D6|nr:2OG-Fe(II) oxygenase [Paracoccus sp. IB05]MBJ2154102.1 2OG-Fe(II) oxygenase [Paracoccus sp. IB05]